MRLDRTASEHIQKDRHVPGYLFVLVNKGRNSSILCKVGFAPFEDAA